MHWLRFIPARLWKYEVTTEHSKIQLTDIRNLVDHITVLFLRGLDISSHKKQNDN